MPILRRSFVFVRALVGVLAALPLLAQAPIELRVEDARGRPAAGVELCLGIDSGDVFGFSALANVAPTTTDRDGLARLQPGPESPTSNLFVQARVLAEPPVRVGVSLRTTEGPVVLRLPPTGSVRVLVYGLDEQPLPGVTAVGLALAGNKRFFDRVEPKGTLQREGAMFAHVALDQRLIATARLAGMHGELRTEVAGPTHAGELTVVELRLTQAHLLTVRVLGLDGKPAANALLPGFLVDADAGRTIAVSTDADGGLRFLVPDFGVGRAEGALVLARRVVGDDEEVPMAYLGSVRIPTEQEWLGDRAIGDVALQPELPMVGGRLLDEDGKPLAGVLLHVTPSHLAGARISESNDDAFGHRVRTDANGAFVVREAAPRTATLRVEAVGVTLRGNGGLAVGDVQAELRAVRRGPVFVALPGLPAGVQVSDLLLREPAPPQVGFLGSGAQPPRLLSVDGGVRFPDVASGAYDLVVTTMYGLPEPVLGRALVERVGAASEPQLSFAEWRQHLWLCRYTVSGERALQRGAQVLAVVVSRAGYESRGYGHLGDAPATLLLPRTHRLTVQGPECCTAIAEANDEPIVLTLQPRPFVQLGLPAGITLPAGLRILLQAKERPWALDPAHVQTDGNAPWSLRPDGAGVFAVRLEAPRGDGGRDEVWHGEVVVPAGAGPHALVLPIDAEVAKELRERMAPAKK